MKESVVSSWEHREEFVQLYNNIMGKMVWGNGTRDHMNDDGEVIDVLV